MEDGSPAKWWDWEVGLQVQCRGMDIICSSESVGGSWHESAVVRRFQAWCIVIRKGCRHSSYWGSSGAVMVAGVAAGAIVSSAFTRSCQL